MATSASVEQQGWEVGDRGTRPDPATDTPDAHRRFTSASDNDQVSGVEPGDDPGNSGDRFGSPSTAGPTHAPSPGPGDDQQVDTLEVIEDEDGSPGRRRRRRVCGLAVR